MAKIKVDKTKHSGVYQIGTQLFKPVLVDGRPNADGLLTLELVFYMVHEARVDIKLLREIRDLVSQALVDKKIEPCWPQPLQEEFLEQAKDFACSRKNTHVLVH